MSQYDFHEYQRKNTQTALKVIFRYLAFPLVFSYWFSLDLVFFPEKKWKILGYRLLILPAAFVSNNLINRFKFFHKNYVIPVFVASLLSSIVVGLILSEYIGQIHVFAFVLNLLAVASSIFIPVPLWAVLIELVIIYGPYLLFTGLTQSDSNRMQIYININSFIGFAVIIFAVRYFQQKRDKEDFANRQSLLADAKIGENIAQISHDTRAPLMALKAIQSGEFDKDQSQHILTKSIGRLIELVEDITQSASSLHLNIQPNDLQNLFTECKSYIEFLHPERKFVWNLNITAPTYSFDKNKIKRVLINLINNSVKATTSNANQPITITATSEEKFSVTVSDHGKGFDSKIDIFEKGTSKFGSSGLGLHFCKQVIQEHGGEITGKSGDGTTEFSFII